MQGLPSPQFADSAPCCPSHADMAWRPSLPAQAPPDLPARRASRPSIVTVGPHLQTHTPGGQHRRSLNNAAAVRELGRLLPVQGGRGKAQGGRNTGEGGHPIVGAGCTLHAWLPPALRACLPVCPACRQLEGGRHLQEEGGTRHARPPAPVPPLACCCLQPAAAAACQQRRAHVALKPALTMFRWHAVGCLQDVWTDFETPEKASKVRGRRADAAVECCGRAPWHCRGEHAAGAALPACLPHTQPAA